MILKMYTDYLLNELKTNVNIYFFLLNFIILKINILNLNFI